MSGTPFVDPAGLLAAWQREYLEDYLPSGNSAVKWLAGKEGSGKTHFLARLRAEAAAAGFLVAGIDAREVLLGKFDDVYRAVARQILPEGIGRKAAARVARAQGLTDWRPDEHGPLLPILMAQGRPEEAARADLTTALDFLYQDRNISPAVATAVRRMAWQQIDPSPAAAELAALAAAWTLGERLSAAERRRIGIRITIDRTGARDVFRSLLFAIAACDLPGLVLTVDGLEALVAKEGPIRYTRLRRDDAYESLREFIDEAGTLPGLFLVLAGRPEVFTDEKHGLKSYPALAMRVVNEIEGQRPNPRNDFQSLDRLWQSRWPEHQAALCRAYGREPDLMRTVTLWAATVSPVKILVEAMRLEDGGGEHGA